MDEVVRRQQREIESLRVRLSLTEATSNPWRAEDISLKLARVLRVWRLRHVKPGSPLWAMGQSVSLLADALLERERSRVMPSGGVEGAAPLLARILDLDPYQAWTSKVEPRLQAPPPPDGPLISVILPVYRVERRHLRATLESLRAQTYRNWEACIAFASPEDGGLARLLDRYARRDARLRVRKLADNFGISGNSNQALEFARGDYIALLDHDDILPAAALANVATAIRHRPDADFLYTDKDLISEDGARRFSPLFKPAWSPEALYSVNYLTHFNVLRVDLVRAIGGWDMGVDGAQDWDLFLRATERAQAVVHVPGVGYSWRVHAASTSTGLNAKPYAREAQLRALSRHAERIGLPGRFVRHPDTDYRVEWRAQPRCRVVMLGGRDAKSLPRLVAHLARERRDFTEVDLLLCPQQAWSFQKAWRARGRRLPSWCRIHPLIGSEPTEACAKLLAAAAEPVTVFVDGGLLVNTPGALRQLSGWLHADGPIAFATGVTVENDDHVVEAGCVLDEAGIAHPLFRAAPLRRWGVCGGPLWHRNVAASSPYLLAIRTRDVADRLAAAVGMDWQSAFHRICTELTGDGRARRGVVDPSARAIVAPGAAFTAPAQGMIGRADRHLHPYLTITPGGEIAFCEASAYAA